MTTFYFSDSRFPQPGGPRSPYLYPPGKRWSSFTLRHWVIFLSPPTTGRATWGSHSCYKGFYHLGYKVVPSVDSDRTTWRYIPEGRTFQLKIISA
jgi:hypothetical protein